MVDPPPPLSSTRVHWGRLCSVCYCYCLTEYTAQLGVGVAGGRRRQQQARAIQVHQLVEKFFRGRTKTIQYNSNDNCYVFCYKKQIETRQAGEDVEQLMKNYVWPCGSHMTAHPPPHTQQPQSKEMPFESLHLCPKNNTSSSETCNISIHTILIEGDGE